MIDSYLYRAASCHFVPFRFVSLDLHQKMGSHGHVDVSQRATYSSEQIQRYHDRILLPKSYRDHPVTSSSDAAKSQDGLDFLTALQRHQVASVPSRISSSTTRAITPSLSTRSISFIRLSSEAPVEAAIAWKTVACSAPSCAV